MLDKTNPMDWVFVLAFLQIFGMKWLLAAFDGTHYFSKIKAKGRKIALVAGMLTIWTPYVGVWITYGHSPFDMWSGTIDLWNMESGGFIMNMFAIIGWAALLSPLMAAAAFFNISRAQRREKKQASDFAIHSKLMRDTGLW